jgi:hypothetical protein
VPVYNFSVEHTPSYFAGQDSLWVHNASGDCHYDPTDPFAYAIGKPVPWPDAKPKGPDWNPVPVDKDKVTQVTRVAEGLRLKMKPNDNLKRRLGLNDDDRISLVYDEKGNPDYNSLRKADGTPIDATPEGGKVVIKYAPLDQNLDLDSAKTKARIEDYEHANEELFKHNPELARKVGAVDAEDNIVKGRPLLNDADGEQKWVWHHSPDGKGMELVDYKVHQLFKHSGGRSYFDNNP